ncbi:ferric enterobactin transport protein FepE [Escherichia coli]|nr:ferric enterobactin transport protein FepE [Escherichia coli]
MSSLNIKQGSEAHFPEYPLASPSNNEIDLLSLIEVLWRAKKNGHGGRFCVCLRRVTDLFHPAAKMDQLSRHYSRRSHSVAGPGENLYQNSAFLISILISTVAVHLTCLSRSFSLLAY